MAASRNRKSPDLKTRVGDFLATRLAPADRICVGLSGGCDSVVLVHALHALALPNPLAAIHVHHGLSPNADAWADFCRRYCAALAIPLDIRHVTVDRQAGLGLEAAARAARYRAFSGVAADVLLLAQHRGDQAETVLFNLLRGSGVVGAAGMPAERSFGALRLLRPLLALARPEIEVYARANGLGWIDDESNADITLSRNYLRHEALAMLATRFPSGEQSLAQAAQHFGEAAELLDELAALDWAAASDGVSASIAGLKLLSLPRLKNLLRYRLRQLGWQVPVAARLEEFARQLHTAGPDRHPALSLPAGEMRVAKGRLGWHPRAAAAG